jgi:GntR family transcriptional regulator
MIEKDSPVPAWRQLAAIIRDQVESGELPPGSRLPSFGDIAHEYGLAVTTVQKAIADLKADGTVITSPMGTWVRR